MSQVFSDGPLRPFLELEVIEWFEKCETDFGPAILQRRHLCSCD